MNAGDDVEAVILNVFEEFEVPREGESINSADLYDETEFPRSVEVAEERLESAGVAVSKRREHGDRAEQILAVAREIDADGIAMSDERTQAESDRKGAVRKRDAVGDARSRPTGDGNDERVGTTERPPHSRFGE